MARSSPGRTLSALGEAFGHFSTTWPASGSISWHFLKYFAEAGLLIAFGHNLLRGSCDWGGIVKLLGASSHMFGSAYNLKWIRCLSSWVRRQPEHPSLQRVIHESVGSCPDTCSAQNAGLDMGVVLCWPAQGAAAQKRQLSSESTLGQWATALMPHVLAFYQRLMWE